MRLLISCLLLTCSFAASADLTIEELIAESGLEEGAVATRDLPGWTASPTLIVPANYVDELSSAFPTARFLAAESSAEATALASEAHAILRYCTPEAVDAARKLVWMQIFSAGAESCLRVQRIGSGEVLLSNAQKMTSPAIGEHAIAMMLALGRQLITYADDMDAGTWDRAPTQAMSSVEDQTMLVVGLGGIGRQVAWRAKGLGMKVLATRNSSRDGPDYVDYVGLSDELLELAARADVIVNAAPLTPETRGLFDETFFSAAKAGHLFINVARGQSVDTDALIEALEDGRVRGAGLDVTDPEPLPPGHVLWSMDNVIITPHVAWAGSNPVRQRLLVIENVRRFLAGEALLNVVDPLLGY